MRNLLGAIAGARWSGRADRPTISPQGTAEQCSLPHRYQTTAYAVR